MEGHDYFKICSNNMKNIIISFIIFIAMLITMLFSVKYLGCICYNLESKCITLENYVDKEDWNKAYSYSLIVLNKWDKYSHTMSIFVHHQEIDDINMEISKMNQQIKCENKAEALASIHTVKFLVKHIINLEKVNIENLL